MACLRTSLDWITSFDEEQSYAAGHRLRVATAHSAAMCSAVRQLMEHMVTPQVAPLLLGTSAGSAAMRSAVRSCTTHQQGLNPNRFPAWVTTLLSSCSAPAADVECSEGSCASCTGSVRCMPAALHFDKPDAPAPPCGVPGLCHVPLGTMRPQVEATGIAQALPWVPWGRPPPVRAGGGLSNDPGSQKLYCGPVDALERSAGPKYNFVQLQGAGKCLRCTRGHPGKHLALSMWLPETTVHL